MKILVAGAPGLGKTTAMTSLTNITQSTFIVTTSVIPPDSHIDAATIDALYSGPIKNAVEGGYSVIIIDEIGELQRQSPAFVAAADAAFNSKATVIATIESTAPFYDEYAGRSNVFTLNMTAENRDELAAGLNALLASLRMYNALSPTRQAFVLSLARGYAKDNQVSSFRRLFQNALIYLAEGRCEEVSAGLYRIRGLTRSHEVFVNDAVWSCDCDLNNGRGQYAGHPAECAHIQTARISRAVA